MEKYGKISVCKPIAVLRNEDQVQSMKFTYYGPRPVDDLAYTLRNSGSQNTRAFLD